MVYVRVGLLKKVQLACLWLILRINILTKIRYRNT